MSIGIYKITNPKGKIYIGQSVNIEKRWKYYINESYNKRDHQNKLFNSLKKYSPENHKFEIIEECSIDQLNEREIYWGLKYDCINPLVGLNLRELGKQGLWTEEAKKKLSKAQLGKKRHTDESKSKISNKLKGTKYTDEQKKKCSENSGMKGKPNYAGGSKKGWKRTQESKDKLSKIKTGKTQPNISKSKQKPIVQYNIHEEFIKEWPSIKIAGETLNISSNSIGLCCRGKLKKSGGFIWKFKKDFVYLT
jgi:group I intron endonuclease